MKSESRLQLASFPSLWCAIDPRAAFAQLAKEPHSVTIWQCSQSALTVAFVMACSALLLASAPLSIWLVASATVYWCVVPLTGLIGFYFAARGSHALSWAQRTDAFFGGYVPWLIWVVLIATVCSLLTPKYAENLVFGQRHWVGACTLLVIAWSAYIDYAFFTTVLRFTRGQALRRVALQRAISWTLFLAVYVFGGFLPFVADLFSSEIE